MILRILKRRLNLITKSMIIKLLNLYKNKTQILKQTVVRILQEVELKVEK